MEVTIELIDYLANLARLKVEDDQKEILKKDMQKMIAFINKLQEIDTTGVEPLMHINNEETILREDIILGSISKEAALSNAPIKDDHFFKVPKVIKK